MQEPGDSAGAPAQGLAIRDQVRLWLCAAVFDILPTPAAFVEIEPVFIWHPLLFCNYSFVNPQTSD